MNMTYLELGNIIAQMTQAQRCQPVITYAGDIDDTIRVIGVAENTDAQMGESLEHYPTNQLFLVLA